MVARALWRSEARRVVPCIGYAPALAYGSCRVSDQGTTLRASDLHNARATILNPFSIGSENGLVPAGHHLNQWWIVNSNLRNKTH